MSEHEPLSNFFNFSLNISLQSAANVWTDEQVIAIKSASAVISYLSIFGALFNLITTLLFKSSSKLVNNMVIALSILDLINSSVFPFSSLPVYEEWGCQLTSFIMYFGYAGSLAMTCCFAHALHATITNPAAIPSEEIFKRYLTISILSGTFIASSSVITELRMLSTSTHTCGHIPEPGTFDEGSFIVLLLPSTISLGYCGYCYIRVMKKLREMSQKVYVVLLFYPLILVITNLPTTILRIITQINSTFQSPFIWTLTATVLIGSRGFLNALGYGLSKRIIEEYKKKCCNKRRRRNTTDLALEDMETNGVRRASTVPDDPTLEMTMRQSIQHEPL